VGERCARRDPRADPAPPDQEQVRRRRHAPGRRQGKVPGLQEAGRGRQGDNLFFFSVALAERGESGTKFLKMKEIKMAYISRLKTFRINFNPRIKITFSPKNSTYKYLRVIKTMPLYFNSF
jgi:hypothetical protein